MNFKHCLPTAKIICFVLFFISSKVFAQNEAEIAKQYLSNSSQKQKLTGQDITAMQVSSQYLSPSTGWYHIYFNQSYQDIEVFNGLLNVTMKGKEIIHVGNSFVENLTSKILPDQKAKLMPIEALQKAALSQELPMSLLNEITTVSSVLLSAGNTKNVVFSDKKLSNENIEVKLYWLPTDNSVSGQTVKLVWNVRFSTLDYKNSWSIHVDANSGEVLRTNDEVIHCDFGTPHSHHNAERRHDVDQVPALKNNMAIVDSSYNVFDLTIESPLHGVRSVVEKPYSRFVPAGTGPAGTNGWHNDGTVDYTITRGNNVWAQEDVNGNNGTGASPSSATLEFDYAYMQDLVSTVANQNAAITNLFYWNNLIHDVLYKYGFDEPSGNFQNNNMGRGGSGNDYVFADAQDGSGSNNANFSTPADGSRGRMQMFLWSDAATYKPDGDFDNGIIAHEYGHGWSTRLTGGPANSSCLQNAEQGGEGWSDYLALMLTTNWASLTDDITSANYSRGIGTYALGQSINDVGIRLYPYSYNMAAINSKVTYGSIGDVAFSVPHGVGSIWATMLWDMTWEIILQDNQIINDIYNTTSLMGNVAALKLVNEGLRLQPCSPSFIQARDAILAADQVLFAGRYKCAISKAFARRGLGIYASTGTSSNDREVVEDFTPFSEVTLSSAINASTCSNTVFNYTATTATSGISYSWTRPEVGGVVNAAGSGNSAIISENLQNNTSLPVTVTYFFTASPTPSCSIPQPVRVVVAPQTLSLTDYSATCSSSSVPAGQGLVSNSKVKVVSGNIVVGPTYARSNGSNSSTYSTGASVYFKAYNFVAPTSGSTIFEITLANLTGLDSDDTYLSLYQTTFNPATPSVNFLRGVDDNGLGFQSRLVNTLTQGVPYVLVVATYASSATGSFTLKSSQPGFNNENFKWFASASGGSELGSGAVFNPVGVPGSGIVNLTSPVSANFYVADADLLSCRTPANFSIQTSTPPPTVLANGPTEFCPGGSVTLSTDIAPNNAMVFNSSNSQYIRVPHSASINLGTSATIEAWVYYSGINNTIIDKGDYDYLWSLNANGNANKMGFYQKTGNQWYYSNDPVPENTWTHVAITLSGGTLTFYINGVASGTAPIAFLQDLEEMNIGRQQPTFCQCNFFNGTMDELRIWNVARTQNDILSNKNNSVSASSSGLVAYYKFDEISGSTTADATANNNHGTLVNGLIRQIPSSSPFNALFWTLPNVSSPQIVASAAGSYTASVTNGLGCVVVSVPKHLSLLSNATLVSLVSPNDNYSSVNVTKTASNLNGKIAATNIISGTSNVSYQAKSIELNAGFKADNGTVFSAQIGGCSP